MPGPRESTRQAICIHNCVSGMCRNATGDALWTCNGNPLRRHAINPRRHPDCTHLCPGNSILYERPPKFRFQLIRQPDGTFNEFERDLDDDENMDVCDNLDESHDMDLDTDIPSQSHWEHPSELDTRIESSPEASEPSLERSPQPAATTWLPISREASQSHSGRSRQPPTVSITGSRTTSHSSDDPHVVDLNDDVQTPDAKKENRSTETFRLLYVPDPTRQCSATRATNDLAFLVTTITIDEWRKVKHLDGSVHPKSKISRMSTAITVCMQEWVF